MPSTTLCQAANPAGCTDERCPQRRQHASQLAAAVQGKNFESFASAKAAAEPSYASVKLPSDFKKVVKALHPDVYLALAGDGLNGTFVTLGLIRIPAQDQGLGLGSSIMGELVKAADRHGWNLALSPDGSFGSSPVRLEVFYRRFGFRPNRGRSRDFASRETMVRYPLS